MRCSVSIVMLTVQHILSICRLVAMDKALAAGKYFGEFALYKEGRCRTPPSQATRQMKRRPQTLPAAIANFYQQKCTPTFTHTARRTSIKRWSGRFLRFTNRNVFSRPESDVGYYPNNLGHTGLSRCVFDVTRRLAFDGRWKNDRSRLQQLSRATGDGRSVAGNP